MRHLSAFRVLLLSLLGWTNAEITVRVANEGSFRLHILTESTLGRLTACSLTSPGNKVTTIPVNSEQPIEDDEIEPIGNGQCGARIRNATNSDAGRWTLTASNLEHSTSQVFRVLVVWWEEPANGTSASLLGSVGKVIQCGPSSMIYCELRNPSGELVELSSTSRCEAVIGVVKASDFGVWECTVGVQGSMEEIRATHTLTLEEPSEEVFVSYNVTTAGHLISWRAERIVPRASFCRAFPPNGETILVVPGHEAGKYSATGTDLDDRKCALLINGDLPDTHTGVWRLEMGLTSNRNIGGFIRIPEGTVPGPDNKDPIADDSETREIKLRLGDPYTISCQTRYPAGYCWIKGPRGQEITPWEELTVGRCSHEISAVTIEHNGTWTCHMAHVGGGPEQRITTAIVLIDKFFEAARPTVTASRGDWAVINCRTTQNHPLQYCRFVRPDGIGLGVVPGIEPSDRYLYHGSGLENGECGLSISPVQSVDYGEWRCVSRIATQAWREENWDTLVLEAPVMSTASAVGLGIGLILLLTVAVGWIVVYRRKRSGTSEEPFVEFIDRN